MALFSAQNCSVARRRLPVLGQGPPAACGPCITLPPGRAPSATIQGNIEIHVNMAIGAGADNHTTLVKTLLK